MATAPTKPTAPAGPGDEPIAVSADGRGAVALSTSDHSLAASAGRCGYDADDVALLRAGAVSLHLPEDVAAAFLDEGITPWGAVGWLAQGFTDAAEAGEYHRWGLNARSAYWVRRDGYTVEDLRFVRHLFEFLAGRRA